MNLFNALFGSKKNKLLQNNEIDTIISYTKNIIIREDLTTDILQKYKSKKNLHEDGFMTAIQTYFALENVIITNRPLIVRREYTKDSLRAEIRENFTLLNLPERFRLIFVSKNEQLLYLFEIYTNELGGYIVNQTGNNRLQQIVGSLGDNLLHNQVKKDSIGIDFTGLHQNAENMSVAEIIACFTKLNATLFSEIESSYGTKSAIDLTERNYQFVKNSYDYDLISKYLEVVPPGILDKERLAFMTREELEGQATEAVKERIRREIVEKSAKDLKQNLDEIKKSKETIEKLLSESHILQDDLRSERDRIKAIISSMNEGLFVVDKDYKVSLMNYSASSMLEVAADLAIGKDIDTLFPITKDNNLIHKENNPISKTLRTGEKVIIDIEKKVYYHSSIGKKFPVMISVSPLYDKNTSAISGAIVIFRDITEAVKYEQNLQDEKRIIEQKVSEQTQEIQNEKAKLLASIKSFSLGFILTDIDQKVIAINSAAKKILNLSDTDESSQLIQDVTKNKFDFQTNIQMARDEKITKENKELLIEEKFLNITITPVFLTDARDEYIGSVILINDITEAKLLEKTKDEFFAIASHELRTPLTAIRGYSSLLQTYYKDKISDPEIFKLIGYIDDSSMHLIDIVNDFLDVSRLEQGRINFKKEIFSMPDLLIEVIHEVGNLATKKNLYLKTENATQDIHPVLGDRERVKQILANLLGNAIKFTTEGGIIVKIEEKQNGVFVQVSDTGKGMSLEGQKRLFQKFEQQANGLTRDVHGGSGLGLYITKKLIENMNGEIYLERSEENKGSTFTFRLPFSLEEVTI